MISGRKWLLAVSATLVFAAWLNAAQERRPCGSCSPMATTLNAMVYQLPPTAK